MHIGLRTELEVQEKARGGYLLSDGDDTAFLAKHFAPAGIEVGSRVEVFLYTDKQGAILATSQVPKVQVGEFGVLDVIELAGPGAYLDWGIERDLLVPFNLQHRPLKVGDRVVVACDVDAYDRVFGSTKLAEFFDRDLSSLALKDEVDLLVYGFNHHGVLFVVNGRFTGLAFHNEVYRELHVGEKLKGWVFGLREDGRVDLTLQRTARKGTLDARDQILELLQTSNGFLGLHDRSSPSEIRQVLSMSKKVFKKAIGALYKDGLIQLESKGIRLAALLAPDGLD